MKKVLVAGATGYLGKYIVKELHIRGYWVRALARKSAKLKEIKDYVDEEFIGEITNPNSLDGICNDIDYVMASVGITRQKDNLSYMDVDYQGNKNLLEQALKSKVSKFIYVSVLNAHSMRQLKIIQAKEKFENALRNSGISYTIIRPNGYFSDMLKYLRMVQQGRAYVFGGGDYEINPIHGKDLAEVCVNALKLSDNEIRVGGPETLSHRQIAELAFQSLDRDPKITSIPIGIKNLALALLRTFTPVKTYGPYEFLLTVLTRDMVCEHYGKEKLSDFFSEETKKLSKK